jgi:Tol biopolymer transport system component/tRNA A-37 threonylcarbamoyl transferase component Bud32
LLGKTLAHYEITDSLGKGGMGEVYRARDTKLGRDVAIKVLPTEMSRNPERLARFDREARTLATLQHANVASIYGFETAGEVRFLVMELAEGEDLSQRLLRGAMAADEVVDLAVQLAKGLATAHAVGVIHRDLKPANIRISTAGKLKILDFGLARAYGAEEGSDTGLEHSPTLTAMTQPGAILGTAAYMSPEQARGKHVDHRADIWAFGVVLFEMLSGQRLFAGETASDTLAGVLRAEVPWEQLPADTTPTLRRLLERCLERDPARRLQAIAEARITLEDLKAGHTDESPPQTTTGGGSRSGRERLVWILAVAALATALASTAVLRKGAPEPALVQSTLLPPAGWDFAPASPFAVSPDGSQIAFVAIARPENEATTAGSNSIWIRDLALPEARHLAATNGDAYPFWSPDSRWLGFYSDGSLNKIEARGGPVIPLCEAADGRGGTWSDQGMIVFQRVWNEGLMKLPAGGGTPVPVTTLDKDRFDVAHRWPHFLPDGRHFLFYVVSTTNPATSEFSGIYLGSLDAAEPRLLLNSESRAIYARGNLLYRAGSTLMARPFDVSAERLTGEATPVASDVTGGSVSWGGAQFGTSEAGVLVHMRGAGATHTLLNWRDRSGQVLDTVGDPSGYWEPRLSHDGKRIAVAVGQDVGDIWIFDLESEMQTRFTFDTADDRTPIWSPDDSQLLFSSMRDGEGGIYIRPTSGQSEAKLLYAADVQVELKDWSRDGRLVLFSRMNQSDGDSEVWTFDLETSEAAPLLTGKWLEDARLSPDGKWLAFASNESGKDEIYVQSFPAGAGRWMISSDTGPGRASRPAWRGDGREIFYFRGSTIVAVPVQGDATFSFGKPTNLFSVSATTASADFAVSPDGQRILTNELPPADLSMIGARLIQNWMSALTR